MNSVREGQDAQAVPANFYRGASHSAHQQRRHAAVLDMVKDLHGSVLDVGCGYGDLAWALSRTLGPVQGVDVDRARVAFASEQYPSIHFTVCRGDRLDFADASFDNVASIVVLPFVADVDVHMSELHRVLKPGGHLVLATRTSPWFNRLYRRVTGRRRRAGLHHHSVGAAKRLLDEQGFEPLRCGAFYDPPFDNPRNLVDWINASGEWIGESVGAVRLAQYQIFLARRRTS